jgi:hypothetical protein
MALVPHPDQTAPVAIFVLLLDGNVVAIAHNGQTRSLGQNPGLALTLLAGPHPTKGVLWLLLGHQNGLLEYQGKLD